MDKKQGYLWLGASTKCTLLFNFLRPNIFIFDDPTSSLDNVVASNIMEDINNDPLWKEKTFIISTNNMNMLKYADKIIYIENGVLEFFGGQSELKQNGHVYSKLMKKIEAQKIQGKDNEVRDNNLFNIFKAK